MLSPSIRRSLGLLAASMFLVMACSATTDEEAEDELIVSDDDSELIAKRCKPGAACNDGNPCTKNDKCDKYGKCVGTAYSCDDKNPCTTDSCDGAGGCKRINNTSSCNDGNSCTTNDRCSNGVCKGTAGIEICNDGKDNDCDGLVDANDPDCKPSCVPSPEICNDGKDNDCDGLIDAADSDCNVVGCPDPTKVECINCQAEECPSGYICGNDSRCHSHCGDGVWNGDEGDKDCGGACGAKCASGKHCWTNWDCGSGRCYYDRCL